MVAPTEQRMMFQFAHPPPHYTPSFFFSTVQAGINLMLSMSEKEKKEWKEEKSILLLLQYPLLSRLLPLHFSPVAQCSVQLILFFTRKKEKKGEK